ncbi:MAG: transposase domain-containing protein, partial [Proteocatella sp.]
MVEIAKENGLNQFPYLEYLFEKLPNIDKTDEKQLSEFLPWSKSITLMKTTRKHTQCDAVVFK